MSNTTLNNDVNNIGFISATIATIMTVIFAISLVMDFWVQTDAISYAVCFILAPAFVSMIISFNLRNCSSLFNQDQMYISFIDKNRQKGSK